MDRHMQNSLITIVGGSGFIGRHLVKVLTEAGYTINILCRDTVAAAALKTAGNPGQIILQHVDISNPESLKGKFSGSFAVINLVSTLVSRGKQRFDTLNIKGADAIAREAKAAGVTRFIQVSALGVNRMSNVHYGKTKFEGENVVRKIFPHATIFRPSVVFGHGDGFFDRFAKMSMLSPALPLIGGGKTLFQPVYVGDVVRAIHAALEKETALGQTYALVGPEQFSFKQMLELMMKTTHRKRCLIKIPFWKAKMLGFISELSPLHPQITRDQVRSLMYDNVRVDEKDGLAELGIAPTALMTMLPDILKRYIVR